MLPVITLVGRPNVGKSTLFNRLTRTRDALVADYPGLTRDRQYGVGRIGPGPYLVVDTGGISGGDGVAVLMERQVRLAIDEADHLIPQPRTCHDRPHDRSADLPRSDNDRPADANTPGVEPANDQVLDCT